MADLSQISEIRIWGHPTDQPKSLKRHEKYGVSSSVELESKSEPSRECESSPKTEVNEPRRVVAMPADVKTGAEQAPEARVSARLAERFRQAEDALVMRLLLGES